MQKNTSSVCISENKERTLFDISTFKEDPNKLIDRGYEYIEEEEYKKAFELFSFAASIDNSDTEILNGLGIALCEMGRLMESRKILERTIRINDEDAVTFANLAGVYWEMEDHDRAIYNYHRSISLDPEIEETYYNIINLYIETGSLYMAFILCLEFNSRFPDNTEATELLSDIILNLAISLY